MVRASSADAGDRSSNGASATALATSSALDAGRRPGERLRPEEVEGCSPHVHELLDAGGVRTQNAEHELHVEGRIEEPGLQEVEDRIEVPDVVRLELGLRTRIAEKLGEPVHVGERVPEDVFARGFEVFDLP